MQSDEFMLIRFRAPKLRKMKNGNVCVELTEAGTWESFPRFANKWTKQIGAKITDRLDGPDVRIWRISYEGQTLKLVYDDFPNGITVEAIDADSNSAINRIFAMVSSEAAPDGV